MNWKEILLNSEDEIWRERPVDFKTFVSHPRFLYKDPELSPVQLEEALRVVGRTPEETLARDRDIHLYVWLWGKGCLARDELLEDALSGEIRTVEEWAKAAKGFWVKALNENFEEVLVKARSPFSKGKAPILKFYLSNENTIKVSPEHRFYVFRREWVKAADLRPGDILWGTNASPVKIRKIETLSEEEIYDFTVPIFHNYFHKGVLHHNSGKGTVSSIIYLYILYLLASMRNPQKFFGTAPSDEISLVNVATNADQARTVVFNRLENRLKKVAWFKENFQIIESGKMVAGNPDSVRRIILKPGGGEIIVEDVNVVARSLHAKAQSWEGKNILYFVLDEASGFKSEKGIANAEEIFGVLTSSTRELPWIGIVTSYPRLPKEIDFTYRLFEEIQSGKRKGYASKRVPWETRPHSFSGETFEFDLGNGATIQVPVEYKDRALEDPEEFKKKYLCMPPSVVEDAFFEYLEEPEAYIDVGREPIVHLREYMEELDGKKYLGKIVERVENSRFPMFLALDAGEKVSDSALVMGHLENAKLVVDAFILWRPHDKIAVNINNVVEVIIYLSRVYRVQGIRIDHWNAASIEAALRRSGVRVKVKNVNVEDYGKLKNALYTGSLRLPDQPESREVIYQLKSLKFKGNKPRVEIGKQDLADALAGLVGLASQQAPVKLPSPITMSAPRKTLSDVTFTEMIGPRKKRLPGPKVL